MGVAYFVVTERAVDGFDVVAAIPDGKSVARASDHLETLATAAGVTSLLEFTSVSPEEAASFGGWIPPEDREPGQPYPEFGGEEPPGPDQFPPEQWFDPAEGLGVIRTLIRAIQDDPAALGPPHGRKQTAINLDDVLADLRDFEVALTRLAAAEVRWHLGIDF